MFNAKQDGRFAPVAAHDDGGRRELTLRFPDGTSASGSWEPGEPVTTDFHGRPVAGRIALGPWSAALSIFCGQPLRLVAVERPGDAVDEHQLTIVSQASIAALRAAGADDVACFDYRRFRMRVEVGGSEPDEEARWVGRDVRSGLAVMHVAGPVPRCARWRRCWPGAARVRPGSRRRPRTLPDGGKVVFGVYAQVVTAANVHLLDRVCGV